MNNVETASNNLRIVDVLRLRAVGNSVRGHGKLG